MLKSSVHFPSHFFVFPTTKVSAAEAKEQWFHRHTQRHTEREESGVFSDLEATDYFQRLLLSSCRQELWHCYLSFRPVFKAAVHLAKKSCVIFSPSNRWTCPMFRSQDSDLSSPTEGNPSLFPTCLTLASPPLASGVISHSSVMNSHARLPVNRTSLKHLAKRPSCHS